MILISCKTILKYQFLEGLESYNVTVKVYTNQLILLIVLQQLHQNRPFNSNYQSYS